MSNVARISVSLEENLLDQLDKAVADEGYPTRSEAIKAFIRQGLIQKEWTKGGEVTGAVALVYDHHRHGLVNRLMSIQHDFVPVIVSTQHIHIDHDNCLEFVVVKGKTKEIRHLVSKLKSVKGVKHNSLLMTTTGKEIG